MIYFFLSEKKSFFYATGKKKGAWINSSNDKSENEFDIKAWECHRFEFLLTADKRKKWISEN